MNVWPQEELTKTIIAIFMPILKAPLVAWDIMRMYANKYSSNQVITLGEFGSIFGFLFFLSIAILFTIGYLYNMYDEQNAGKKTEPSESLGLLFSALPLAYIAINLVIFFLLKAFFNY